MKPCERVNDRSNHLPRLEVHQSWWAMRGVGDDNGEWSLEEKIERIAAAGFDGILGRLPAPDEAKLWRRLLDKYRLNFGIEAFPAERDEFALFLKQAKEFGVSYVNAQVMDSYIIGDAAVMRLRGLMEEAAEAEIPFFVETHRGRITQDLLRTAEYVQALPNLRLTIDFSHYVLAGEMIRPDEKAEPYLQMLLERTSCIHGRVSNGEQIQVDIGPHGEHPMTERFLGWWKTGMSHWLKEASPGDILPFVCELGPIPYAITRKSYTNPPEEEISDRWEQTLLFKRLAEEAWNSVGTAGRSGPRGEN
ncbi:sugar phosphate isomerase/epimerase family protein [Brevibacillus sp. H7]|jgi:hypothetical protein|uniref:sugar phosphate isomerase/epimerase family protein n=1 Tax=Brevibacillus sp. H7 TaxID=3349138 RepID=UPI0038210900